MTSSSLSRIAVGGILLIIFGYAAQLALRTVAYDYETNLVQAHPRQQVAQALLHVRRACMLRPDLSQAWRLRAQLSSLQNPQQAQTWAWHAIGVDPTNWRNWNILGLIDFQLDDMRGAQLALARSAVLDDGFSAHFAAANLAFILGDQTAFWKQMKAALHIAPAVDIKPALQDLMRLAGDHPPQILRILPASRPAVLSPAIRLLVHKQDFNAAFQIWQRLNCVHDKTDCGNSAMSLITQSEQQVSAWEKSHARTGPTFSPDNTTVRLGLAQAAQVWNQAIAKNYFSAAPQKLGTITDSHFQFPWIGGFTWQSWTHRPLTIASGNGVNAVEYALNGDEPDQETFFGQNLRVVPHASYSVSYEIQATGPSLPPGLSLVITWPEGSAIATMPAIQPGATWSTVRGNFTAPAHAELLNVLFQYARPFGKPLWQGTFFLRNIQVRPLLPAVPAGSAAVDKP